jgi:hypothetical protein
MMRVEYRFFSGFDPPAEENAMTMQVKCPNGACGKVLTVQEEYAGKKGKCPGCGNEMTIPAAANGDDAANWQPSAPGARRDQSSSEPAMVLPAAASRAVNEYAIPIGKNSDAHSASNGATGMITRAGLGIGVCCLMLLSFSPQMEWIYLSTPPRPRGVLPNSPETGRRDGLSPQSAIGDAFLDSRAAAADFRYYSLAVAVLALVALTLTQTAQRDWTDGAIAASGSFAVGWGVMAGIWQLGIAWKVFALATLVRDQQVFGPNRNADTSIWPGPGLALGLFAALIVVAVFGSLVASRKRFLWLVTGATMGGGLGILMLVLHVKPLQDLGP